LIEYVKSGVFRITERGKQLVAKNPTVVNLKVLDQYPEHYEWFHSKKDSTEKSEPVTEPLNETQTPEERIEALAEDLSKKLSSDLLDRIKEMDPFRFERVVLDLLLAMGYGGSRKEAAEIGKGVNDGGIDGLINEDRLGLDRIYIQAKRWQGPVGRPQIQNFVGALAGQNASRGIFLTTSDFSAGAVEFVKTIQQRVILIDGQRLAELMIEHNIGVSRSQVIEVKKVDSDYFDEE
jgi:restriction system protein